MKVFFKQNKTLLVLFFVVLLIQCVFGYAIATNFSSWQERGTFGDMFGAVNTLFSGLAFAGVIYAIFLQSQELELQREELKLTRTELSKSAIAQNELVKVMLLAANINGISSKLNTHTTLLVNNRNFKNPKSQIDIDSIEDIIKELDTIMRLNKIE